MAEETLKEKTAKGLFWGGMSNGVQQILGVVIGLVLLDRLSPGDYGMVGMLAIFTGIANALLESGFTAALTNRPVFKDEDYNSVFWFNVFVGVAMYVILFFCAPLIALFFHQPDLVPLARVLFLSILFNSFIVSHNAALFTKLMVKERAIADMLGTFLSGFIGIYLAVHGFGYWALAWQSLFYVLVGTLVRIYYSPWHPTWHIDFRPVKEMFGFGFKLLFSNIVNQIQTNIFSVLLGRFYTKVDVGYYSQGTKWSSLGAQLLTGSISGIAQPVLSQTMNDEERQVYVFRKLLRFIAFISFPMMFGIAFIARDLIGVINAEFLPCVPILQMYCISFAFNPMMIVYSNVAISHNRAGIYFWGIFIYAAVQILVAFLVLPYGIYWMAFSIVLVNLIYYLIWHYLIQSCMQVRLIDVIKDVAPYLVITLSVFAVVFLITMKLSNLFLILTLKILLSVILYVAILKISKSTIFNEALAFVKGGKIL